ncbi:Indoleamine 2,3-dioxygenase 2, partial [Schistosoma japonicum]
FYCLSDKTGAISENPLKTLPSKWKAWNDLVDQLPELSRNKTLRKEVDSLPLLDLDGLNSHEELRLAHKILAFLSSVYVWQDGEGGETESIPIQIAKPLLCVSKLLGIQPILTNSDLVLCNCIPSSSTEGENYLRWSHGKLKDKGLIYETSIQQVNNNTEITESSCPFSSKGNTSDSNRRMCIGASAAQSLTIQACDAFFQIKHHPEDEEFFKKMQTYMITEHRQFLEDLAMYSRIRSIAVESKSSELKSNYNQCLQSLWNFRNSHISLVNRFIIEPSKKAEAKIKQLEVTGTSGQCLKVFLQRVRDASNSATLK